MSNTKFHSKSKLIEKITIEYARLDEFVSTLSEKQLTKYEAQGIWTVKDIVAHIASWESLAADRLEAAKKDTKLKFPIIKNWDDIDAFNESCYLGNKFKTSSEVYKESHSIHQFFLACVLELDDSFFAKALPFDWADELTVFEFIAENSFLHYKEHYNAIVNLFSDDMHT